MGIRIEQDNLVIYDPIPGLRRVTPRWYQVDCSEIEELGRNYVELKRPGKDPITISKGAVYGHHVPDAPDMQFHHPQEPIPNRAAGKPHPTYLHKDHRE